MICLKSHLKPEEAMLYTNLERTRLALKCKEYGIYKNANGYYSREDLELILSGAPSKIEQAASKMEIGVKNARRKGGGL